MVGPLRNLSACGIQGRMSWCKQESAEHQTLTLALEPMQAEQSWWQTGMRQNKPYKLA